MAFTAVTARQRIEDDTQWQAAPALTTAEVDRLLLRARSVDVNGVLPDATGYVTTYSEWSVRAATAAGWLMKAGKVQPDVKAGDVGLERSQQFDFCRRQAAYFGGITGSIGAAPAFTA